MGVGVVVAVAFLVKEAQIPAHGPAQATYYHSLRVVGMLEGLGPCPKVTENRYPWARAG